MQAEIGAICTAVVGAFGAAYGLLQYNHAENWKRAAFTVSQVRIMSDDPTFAFCCRALDWGVGPLIIPEKYRPIFPGKEVTVDHDWALMTLALKTKLQSDFQDPVKGPQYLLYRYCFDDFLSYLDGLALYRKLGVVRKSDLHSVEYYLRRMGEPEYGDGVHKGVFAEFIAAFYPTLLPKWISELVS